MFPPVAYRTPRFEAANGKRSSDGVKGKNAEIGPLRADSGGLSIGARCDTLRPAMESECGGREERFSTAGLGGVQLHAIHWGDEGAPCLVLLHGAGANAHWWDHLAPALARRFHVVALDFRGHGDSDHPEERIAGAFGDDLEALLEHLGAPEATLMGHSLGAHVAMGHAAEADDTPALVLVDPSRGASPSRRRATRLALTLRRTYASRQQAVEKFRFLPGAAHAAPELRRAIAGHSIRVEPDGRFGFKFDPYWFSVPPRRRPDLARIQCPTLLLRGADSKLLPAEGAAEMAAAIPDCRLHEVPGAGHHVHIDAPTAVLDATTHFLGY